MPRHATIITGDDGDEIVSAIGEFEGSSLPRRAGRVEAVAPGVLIGMVRGGPVDAVGGFGFPLGSQGIDARAIGIARADKAKAIRPAAIQAAQTTGVVASAKTEADTVKPQRKPTKAKPARARRGKGKSAKSSSRAARSTPASSANTAAPAAIPGRAEPAVVSLHG